MEIVNPTKFAIAILFLVVGVAILWLSRGGRGFNQRKQAGALFLVGAAVFLSVGLGLVDL
jgi:drug/metabolite transporter (DMT)-like permease